jgi:hypothetical protein
MARSYAHVLEAIALAIVTALTGAANAGEHSEVRLPEAEKALRQLQAMHQAMREQDRADLLVVLKAYKKYCNSTIPPAASLRAIVIQHKEMPSHAAIHQASLEVLQELKQDGIGPWCRRVK